MNEVRPIDRRDLRLTGLTLANWRNFTAVETPLRQRMFLVGPNASGKSNLLDSFRFLSDIVTVGGGFQAAVARRGGVSMIRSFAARKNPNVTVRVQLGTDASPTEWDYELTFSQDNQRRPQIKRERVVHRGETLLERPSDEDVTDPDRLRQTHLEQVNVNREFRDIADFLATIRYMHIVPQLVREPDRSVGRVNDPFGGDFLEQIAGTPKRTRDARFKRIVNALRVAVPQLEELDLQNDVKGVPHLRGKYKHWRQHGAWQSEEHFSDGTLRLMGLLWAVAEGSGPLLLEEPELSLHVEVVRNIPQMLARMQRRTGRQVLLSSHSAEMLSDEGIGLDEVLVLTPEAEGTKVALAADNPEVPTLRQVGIGLAEVLSGLTAPKAAHQLALFGQ